MAEWSKALRSGRSPLLRAWVRIPLLTNQPFFFFFLFLFNVHQEETHGFTDSRVAQWKRAGPITQRSVDRNYPLLDYFSLLLPLLPFTLSLSLLWNPGIKQSVPLAQRIARWTSNPKVLGSIPRWDETQPILSDSSQLSGWPSGLRRQTQGSNLAPLIGGGEWEFWSSYEGVGSNPTSDK